MAEKISKTQKSSTVKMIREKPPELTSEQAIKEIRSLRAGRLFVSNMELVDKLLESYDGAMMAANSLAEERRKLDVQIAAALVLLRNMLQTFISTRDNERESLEQIRKYVFDITGIPIAEDWDLIDFILASHLALLAAENNT